MMKQFVVWKLDGRRVLMHQYWSNPYSLFYGLSRRIADLGEAE